MLDNLLCGGLLRIVAVFLSAGSFFYQTMPKYVGVNVEITFTIPTSNEIVIIPKELIILTENSQTLRPQSTGVNKIRNGKKVLDSHTKISRNRPLLSRSN